MGDIGEDGKAIDELREANHKRWYESNTKTLSEAGIPFEDKGTAYLIRVEGKPRVDFYPHTGRWKSVDHKGKDGQLRIFKGGARAFLKWWAKQ